MESVAFGSRAFFSGDRFSRNTSRLPAGQRYRLERVCRYPLRPPVTQERLHLTGEGQVRLQLRQPWRNGTTDLVFDPIEFLGRLAVGVPRPRVNLMLYHGVLGPRAAWPGLTWFGAKRRGLVAAGRKDLEGRLSR
jgi:hypothetical protein